MPRPTTKSELLQAGDENLTKLLTIVDSLTPDQLECEFPFDDRDRNVRDVLAHLHEWHLMMIEWYRVGMSGQKPEMPAPGYTWQTLPALNETIWHKYQATDLTTIRKAVEASHSDLRSIIDSHTDEELFTKKYYPWTGTTSLGAYVISATSSHYDWAIKKLRKFQKSMKG